MTAADYERLRDAILAYAHALRRAGAALDADAAAWTDSAELDRLWSEVLAAAQLTPDELEQLA